MTRYNRANDPDNNYDPRMGFLTVFMGGVFGLIAAFVLYTVFFANIAFFLMLIGFGICAYYLINGE
jgi:hypothetical protein